MRYKIMGLAVAAVLLTACGTERQAPGHPHEHAASGDLRETTASVSELPDFLDGKPESMRVVYEAAGRAADLLDVMPCYCGCGESAGHRSNRDCFIHAIEADGSVVWDDHGTRCGVCLDIAVQAIDMRINGMTDRDIRAAIDDLYDQGYAAPTDTPMPKEA